MTLKPTASPELNLPTDYLDATLLASGLSVLVLVGLFHYLNRYTQRRYFTIWTAAWLFYGLWLAFHFSWVQSESSASLMMKQFSIGLAATFLIWGSANFLNQDPPQTLLGAFMAFLLVWCYLNAYFIKEPLYSQVPMFALLGLASIVTAAGFYRLRHKNNFVGAGLLAFGFLIWGVHLAIFPFWAQSSLMGRSNFLSAAVVQLFIAVSMIVLVLEEARAAQERDRQELQLRKAESSLLTARVISTEERYRSLFDQASEGIILVDAGTLNILELNQTARRLLEVKSAADSGQSFRMFCQSPLTLRSGEPAQWFALHAQGAQVRLVGREGSSVLVEISGAPINLEGRPAYQFFVRELTERERLEQQLRQAEKLSALGRMISGVAHELNNPLAVIKGYVELILARHSLHETTREDLGKVAQESNRAAKLVSNFTSFARAQPVSRKPVDLNVVVRRAVDLRQIELRDAAVQVHLALAEALPKLQADSDQVEQVLTSLLSNAVHALTDSTKERCLKISTRASAEFVYVVVEDSGPGVPEALQPKIFEPFFTTKEVGAGTGLGLSIAHSVMADHQGRIFYQPSCYGGAGFVLEFPILPPPAARPGPKPAVESVLEAPAAPPTQPVRAKILVLDDEEALAELLGQMLELLGHLPTVCNSGLEAVDLITRNDFSLVISDFRMPVMDGQQFYQAVTQIKPELARRIIFLTGDLTNEDAKTFLESSGSPHLAKPFQLSNVEQLVNQILQEKPLPKP
jgi:PAS domain S-box-containing protein